MKLMLPIKHIMIKPQPPGHGYLRYFQINNVPTRYLRKKAEEITNMSFGFFSLF
jgi:hypothetical protein